MSSENERLVKWFFSWRVGASAKTMVAALAGVDPCDFATHNANIPHDCDDLGRCIFLLDSVPEFRPRLAMVGERFTKFQPYIERWEELEKLHRESHCPKTGDAYTGPKAVAARYRCQEILDVCRVKR